MFIYGKIRCKMIFLTKYTRNVISVNKHQEDNLGIEIMLN